MSWKCPLAASLILGVLAGCNSTPCGGSGAACCGAGVCNRPLVCVAGTCGPTTPRPTPRASPTSVSFWPRGRRAETPSTSSRRRCRCSRRWLPRPARPRSTSRSPFNPCDSSWWRGWWRRSRVRRAGTPRASSRSGPRASPWALDAGRIVWNGPADTECQMGLQSSQYLTAAVLSPDGGFAGGSQVFGPSGKQGSAPCDELLQGQLTLGQSCQDGAECQPGLYCQPASASSCGGICAVPDGGCGPLDLCPGQALPYVSLGGGLQTALAIGTACDAGAGCGPCEVCVGNRCAAGVGGLGVSCAAQPCLAPFLFCDNATTMCASTHLLGEACLPGVGSCLMGSCLGSPPTCSPPGGPGEPCDPSLAPAACDAGVCAPGSSGGTVCQPFPDAGDPCLQLQCGPGAVCDPDSTTCQVPRGGGEACAMNAQCQSGFCVVPDGGAPDAGACLSPCIQPPDSGCLNLYSSSSFFLGLGGAMMLGRRQRRFRRAREARSAPPA